MKLRLASENDFAALCALYDAVIAAVAGTDRDPIWDRSTHPTDEALHAAIAAGSMLVGELDDRVVCALILDQNFAAGYEQVEWPSALPAESVLCLHLFATDPSLGGRGLGREMLELTRAWAMERGYGAIRLDVLSYLSGPRHLYEKVGFVDLGEFDLSYPDPRVKHFNLYELVLG